MKRLRRILLNAATGVSLVLLTGLIVWRGLTEPTLHFLHVAVNSAGRRPIPIYEYRHELLGVPFAFWIAAAIVLPLIHVVNLIVSVVAKPKAARSMAVRRCPACGYDLRATPERCPE